MLSHSHVLHMPTRESECKGKSCPIAADLSTNMSAGQWKRIALIRKTMDVCLRLCECDYVDWFGIKLIDTKIWKSVMDSIVRVHNIVAIFLQDDSHMLPDITYTHRKKIAWTRRVPTQTIKILFEQYTDWVAVNYLLCCWCISLVIRSPSNCVSATRGPDILPFFWMQQL